MMGGEIVISDNLKKCLNLLISLQTIIHFSKGWRIPIRRI